MKLSAVLITLNEERKLPGCLSHLDFADEIIVVDSFSKDQTVQLAEQSGAKVVQRAFDSFSGQKNHGIQMAKGEWILLIDADEIVTPALRDEIQLAIRSQEHRSAFTLRRVNKIFGGVLRHGASGEDHPIRLVRNGKGFFEGLVHEKLRVEGELGALRGELTHITYQTLDEYFSKFNQFSTLDAQEFLRQKGEPPSWLQILVRPAAEFVFYYIVKAGFLDGWRGFQYQVLSSFYVFIKYAKARNRDK
ncbi:MAG: glycosyltransferase family 2 protein [Candidatus Omnitrophota bacterium]